MPPSTGTVSGKGMFRAPARGCFASPDATYFWQQCQKISIGVFRAPARGMFRGSDREVLLPMAAKVPKNAIQTCGLKIRPRYGLFMIVSLSLAFAEHGRCRAI